MTRGAAARPAGRASAPGCAALLPCMLLHLLLSLCACQPVPFLPTSLLVVRAGAGVRTLTRTRMEPLFIDEMDYSAPTGPPTVRQSIPLGISIPGDGLTGGLASQTGDGAAVSVIGFDAADGAAVTGRENIAIVHMTASGQVLRAATLVAGVGVTPWSPRIACAPRVGASVYVCGNMSGATLVRLENQAVGRITADVEGFDGATVISSDALESPRQCAFDGEGRLHVLSAFQHTHTSATSAALRVAWPEPLHAGAWPPPAREAWLRSGRPDAATLMGDLMLLLTSSSLIARSGVMPLVSSVEASSQLCSLFETTTTLSCDGTSSNLLLTVAQYLGYNRCYSTSSSPCTCTVQFMMEPGCTLIASLTGSTLLLEGLTLDFIDRSSGDRIGQLSAQSPEVIVRVLDFSVDYLRDYSSARVSSSVSNHVASVLFRCVIAAESFSSAFVHTFPMRHSSAIVPVLPDLLALVGPTAIEMRNASGGRASRNATASTGTLFSGASRPPTTSPASAVLHPRAAARSIPVTTAPNPHVRWYEQWLASSRDPPAFSASASTISASAAVGMGSAPMTFANATATVGTGLRSQYKSITEITSLGVTVLLEDGCLFDRTTSYSTAQSGIARACVPEGYGLRFVVTFSLDDASAYGGVTDDGYLILFGRGSLWNRCAVLPTKVMPFVQHWLASTSGGFVNTHMVCLLLWTGLPVCVDARNVLTVATRTWFPPKRQPCVTIANMSGKAFSSVALDSLSQPGLTGVQTLAAVGANYVESDSSAMLVQELQLTSDSPSRSAFLQASRRASDRVDTLVSTRPNNRIWVRSNASWCVGDPGLPLTCGQAGPFAAGTLTPAAAIDALSFIPQSSNGQYFKTYSRTAWRLVGPFEPGDWIGGDTWGMFASADNIIAAGVRASDGSVMAAFAGIPLITSSPATFHALAMPAFDDVACVAWRPLTATAPLSEFRCIGDPSQPLVARWMQPSTFGAQEKEWRSSAVPVTPFSQVPAVIAVSGVSYAFVWQRPEFYQGASPCGVHGIGASQCTVGVPGTTTFLYLSILLPTRLILEPVADMYRCGVSGSNVYCDGNLPHPQLLVIIAAIDAAAGRNFLCLTPSASAGTVVCYFNGTTFASHVTQQGFASSTVNGILTVSGLQNAALTASLTSLCAIHGLAGARRVVCFGYIDEDAALTAAQMALTGVTAAGFGDALTSVFGPSVRPVQVAIGRYVLCVRYDGGLAKCWSDVGSAAAEVDATIAAGVRFTMIAAGGRSVCAVTDQSELRCYGGILHNFIARAQSVSERWQHLLAGTRQPFPELTMRVHPVVGNDASCSANILLPCASVQTAIAAAAAYRSSAVQRAITISIESSISIAAPLVIDHASSVSWRLVGVDTSITMSFTPAACDPACITVTNDVDMLSIRSLKLVAIGAGSPNCVSVLQSATIVSLQDVSFSAFRCTAALIVAQRLEAQRRVSQLASQALAVAAANAAQVCSSSYSDYTTPLGADNVASTLELHRVAVRDITATAIVSATRLEGLRIVHVSVSSAVTSAPHFFAVGCLVVRVLDLRVDSSRCAGELGCVVSAQAVASARVHDVMLTDMQASAPAAVAASAGLPSSPVTLAVSLTVGRMSVRRCVGGCGVRFMGSADLISRACVHDFLCRDCHVDQSIVKFAEASSAVARSISITASTLSQGPVVNVGDVGTSEVEEVAVTDSLAAGNILSLTGSPSQTAVVSQLAVRRASINAYMVVARGVGVRADDVKVSSSTLQGGIFDAQACDFLRLSHFITQNLTINATGTDSPVVLLNAAGKCEVDQLQATNTTLSAFTAILRILGCSNIAVAGLTVFQGLSWQGSSHLIAVDVGSANGPAILHNSQFAVPTAISVTAVPIRAQAIPNLAIVDVMISMTPRCVPAVVILQNVLHVEMRRVRIVDVPCVAQAVVSASVFDRLSVSDTTVERCSNLQGDGGAFNLASSAAVISIRNLNVTACTAAGNGGAMFVSLASVTSSSLTLLTSTFMHNAASVGADPQSTWYGGAVAIEFLGANGRRIVPGVQPNLQHPNLIATGLTFRNSTVQAPLGVGGALHIASRDAAGAAVATLNDVAFIGNTARMHGGAFNLLSVVATVRGLKCVDNTAGRGSGGCGYLDASSITVDDAIVSRNRASSDGGGLYAQTCAEPGIQLLYEDAIRAAYVLKPSQRPQAPTPSPAFSQAPTPSRTRSPAMTSSKSPASTRTASSSVTRTRSASGSVSGTRTPSRSVSRSISATRTVSETVAASRSASITPAISRSASRGASRLPTASVTWSASAAPSTDASVTATHSPDPSPTATSLASTSMEASPTESPTNSMTASTTPSVSVLATSTPIVVKRGISSGVQFAHNSASRGGAIALISCSMIAAGTAFVSNFASATGGALLATGSCDVSVSLAAFAGNAAGSTLTWQVFVEEATRFTSAAADGAGGAIAIVDPASPIDVCTLRAFSSGFRALSLSGSAQIQYRRALDVVLQATIASFTRRHRESVLLSTIDAVRMMQGAIEQSNDGDVACAFGANSAAAFGADVYYRYGTSASELVRAAAPQLVIQMDNCAMSHSTAGYAGGSIYAQKATLLLNNCSFASTQTNATTMLRSVNTGMLTYGGAIALVEPLIAQLRGVRVERSSSTFGGALWIRPLDTTWQPSSDRAPAIPMPPFEGVITQPTISFEDVTIVGSQASSRGGGIMIATTVAVAGLVAGMTSFNTTQAAVGLPRSVRSTGSGVVVTGSQTLLTDDSLSYELVDGDGRRAIGDRTTRCSTLFVTSDGRVLFNMGAKTFTSRNGTVVLAPWGLAAAPGTRGTVNLTCTVYHADITYSFTDSTTKVQVDSVDVELIADSATISLQRFPVLVPSTPRAMYEPSWSVCLQLRARGAPVALDGTLTIPCTLTFQEVRSSSGASTFAQIVAGASVALNGRACTRIAARGPSGASATIVSHCLWLTGDVIESASPLTTYFANMTVAFVLGEMERNSTALMTSPNAVACSSASRGPAEWDLAFSVGAPSSRVLPFCLNASCLTMAARMVNVSRGDSRTLLVTHGALPRSEIVVRSLSRLLPSAMPSSRFGDGALRALQPAVVLLVLACADLPDGNTSCSYAHRSDAMCSLTLQGDTAGQETLVGAVPVPIRNGTASFPNVGVVSSRQGTWTLAVRATCTLEAGADIVTSEDLPIVIRNLTVAWQNTTASQAIASIEGPSNVPVLQDPTVYLFETVMAPAAPEVPSFGLMVPETRKLPPLSTSSVLSPCTSPETTGLFSVAELSFERPVSCAADVQYVPTASSRDVSSRLTVLPSFVTPRSNHTFRDAGLVASTNRSVTLVSDCAWAPGVRSQGASALIRLPRIALTCAVSQPMRWLPSSPAFVFPSVPTISCAMNISEASTAIYKQFVSYVQRLGQTGTIMCSIDSVYNLTTTSGSTQVALDRSGKVTFTGAGMAGSHNVSTAAVVSCIWPSMEVIVSTPLPGRMSALSAVSITASAKAALPSPLTGPPVHLRPSGGPIQWMIRSDDALLNLYGSRLDDAVTCSVRCIASRGSCAIVGDTSAVMRWNGSALVASFLQLGVCAAWNTTACVHADCTWIDGTVLPQTPFCSRIAGMRISWCDAAGNSPAGCQGIPGFPSSVLYNEPLPAVRLDLQPDIVSWQELGAAADAAQCQVRAFLPAINLEPDLRSARARGVPITFVGLTILLDVAVFGDRAALRGALQVACSVNDVALDPSAYPPGLLFALPTPEIFVVQRPAMVVYPVSQVLPVPFSPVIILGVRSRDTQDSIFVSGVCTLVVGRTWYAPPPSLFLPFGAMQLPRPFAMPMGTLQASLTNTDNSTAVTAAFPDYVLSTSFGASVEVVSRCSRTVGGPLPETTLNITTKVLHVSWSGAPPLNGSAFLTGSLVALELDAEWQTRTVDSGWAVVAREPAVDIVCSLRITQPGGRSLVSATAVSVASNTTSSQGRTRLAIDVTGPAMAVFALQPSCSFAQQNAYASGISLYIAEVIVRPIVPFPSTWLPADFGIAKLPFKPVPSVVLAALGTDLPSDGTVCYVRVLSTDYSSATSALPTALLDVVSDGYAADFGENSINFPGISLRSAYGAMVFLGVDCQRRNREYARRLVVAIRVVLAGPILLDAPPADVAPGVPFPVKIAYRDMNESLSDELRNASVAAVAVTDFVTVCSVLAVRAESSQGIIGSSAGQSNATYLAGMPAVTGLSVLGARDVAEQGVVYLPTVAISARVGSLVDGAVICRIGTLVMPFTAPYRTLLTPCGPGSAPSASGLTCVPCLDGTYSDGGVNALRCIPCPSQGTSCSGGVLRFQPGFFRADSGSTVDESTEIHPCWYPEGCEVDTSTTNRSAALTHRCARGYTGPLCGVCDARSDGGYARVGQKCAACVPEGVSWFVVSLIPVATLLVGFWAATRSATVSAPRAPLIRIGLAHMQVVGTLMSAYIVQGTKRFREAFGFTEVAGVSPFALGPVVCVIRTNFFQRYAGTIALPLVIILATLTARGLLELWKRTHRPAMPKRAQRLRSARWSKPQEPLPLQQRVRASLRKVATVVLDPALLGPAIFVLSVTYTGTISSSFQALECHEARVAGVQYLRQDLTLECRTPMHVTIMFVAAAVLVVLGMGLPVYFAWTLRRLQARLLTPSVFSAWSFLYDGLHIQRGVTYESCVMLRKTLVVLIASVVKTDAYMQLLSSGLLVLCSTLLLAYLRPYASRIWVVVEMLSLGAIGFCILSTVVYVRAMTTVEGCVGLSDAAFPNRGALPCGVVRSEAVNAEWTVTAALFVLNLAFFIVWITLMVRLARVRAVRTITRGEKPDFLDVLLGVSPRTCFRCSCVSRRPVPSHEEDDVARELSQLMDKWTSKFRRTSRAADHAAERSVTDISPTELTQKLTKVERTLLDAPWHILDAWRRAWAALDVRLHQACENSERVTETVRTSILEQEQIAIRQAAQALAKRRQSTIRVVSSTSHADSSDESDPEEHQRVLGASAPRRTMQARASFAPAQTQRRRSTVAAVHVPNMSVDDAKEARAPSMPARAVSAHRRRSVLAEVWAAPSSEPRAAVTHHTSNAAGNDNLRAASLSTYQIRIRGVSHKEAARARTSQICAAQSPHSPAARSPAAAESIVLDSTPAPATARAAAMLRSNSVHRVMQPFGLSFGGPSTTAQPAVTNQGGDLTVMNPMLERLRRNP